MISENRRQHSWRIMAFKIYKWLSLSLLAVFVLPSSVTFGKARQPTLRNASAGVAQLVEKRAGRVACLGVVINLGRFRYKERIAPEQLEIREAKHGHDLKE